MSKTILVGAACAAGAAMLAVWFTSAGGHTTVAPIPEIAAQVSRLAAAAQHLERVAANLDVLAAEAKERRSTHSGQNATGPAKMSAHDRELQAIRNAIQELVARIEATDAQANDLRRASAGRATNLAAATAVAQRFVSGSIISTAYHFYTPSDLIEEFGPPHTIEARPNHVQNWVYRTNDWYLRFRMHNGFVVAAMCQPVPKPR